MTLCHSDTYKSCHRVVFTSTYRGLTLKPVHECRIIEGFPNAQADVSMEAEQWLMTSGEMMRTSTTTHL